MATHASALKAHRQSLKNREQNRQFRARLRNALRNVRAAVDGNDLAGAKTALKQTVSLIETTGNGGLVAIFATAGALLALCGSLLGALAAASRESGVPLSDEFRIWRRSMDGPHKETTIVSTPDVHRDETTIIPPTH